MHFIQHIIDLKML